MTNAGKAVRLINSLRNHKNTWVFNDRIKNGGRSIKVHGWGSEDYDYAQQFLQELGFTVERVVTPISQLGWAWSGGGNTRLHVWENAPVTLN